MPRKAEGLEPAIEVKTTALVLFSDPIGFFAQERRLEGIRAFSTFKTGKVKIRQFYDWCVTNEDKLQKMTIHRVLGILRRLGVRAAIFRPKKVG